MNSLNDVLLGFSQFSSSQYGSAGYAFKARGDASGTMRDPYIYKSGIDYYEKTYGSGRNRWGDYSHTCVDPVDDFGFWTIQEFADTKVGTGDGSGRWNTWWANVVPSDPLPIQLVYLHAMPTSPNSVQLDWGTLTETNNYGFKVQKTPDSSSSYLTITGSFVPGHGTTIEPHSYTYTDVAVSSGSWWYRLMQIDLDGAVHYTDAVRVDLLTGLDEKELPFATSLEQNYPNPFNPSTEIHFTLERPANVVLQLFDVLGREVATLMNERRSAGKHSVTWIARDHSSGLYFARLSADGFVSVRKLVLAK